MLRANTHHLAPPDASEKRRVATRTSRDAVTTAALVVLGANVWVLSLGLPAIYGAALDRWEIAFAVLPLAVLSVFAPTLQRPEWRRVATWALLGAFPGGIGSLVLANRTLRSGELYSSPFMFFIVISWGAYGAYVLGAIDRGLPLRKRTTAPLEPDAHAPPDRRLWWQRGLLSTVAAAAFLIVITAPFSSSRAQLERHWPGAVNDALVLSAVFGGALGCMSLAWFVAPALRMQSVQATTRSTRRARVIGSLLVASASLVVYYLYHLTYG